MHSQPPGPADWSVKQLEESDELFLPTYSLWQHYCDDLGCQDPGCEEFEQMLRSDKRLYVTPGASAAVPGQRQEILSQMGLPVRTLTGLAGKKPSGEALENAIRAKAAQLHHALRKAWEARPLDGPEVEKVEKKLLFLMEQAQKLCDALGADSQKPK